MTAIREKTGECRQCRSFCDKMVEPRGCVEMRCRYLYSFVDMLSGSQYVGCMQDVFAAKVDLEAVLQPGGFGGVKMTGDALPSYATALSPRRYADAEYRRRLEGWDAKVGQL